MSNRPKTTIHVGGLSTQCDESTLYTSFEPFGEIMQVQLPKLNQHATTHRGFGFVEFSSDEEAESAVDNMHLNEIDGQIITVNLAKPLKTDAAADSRKPIWESEEWIKEFGGGRGGGEGETSIPVDGSKV